MIVEKIIKLYYEIILFLLNIYDQLKWKCIDTQTQTQVCGIWKQEFMVFGPKLGQQRRAACDSCGFAKTQIVVVVLVKWSRESMKVGLNPLFLLRNDTEPS